jgi:hypothetical protein
VASGPVIGAKTPILMGPFCWAIAVPADTATAATAAWAIHFAKPDLNLNNISVPLAEKR